MSRNAFEEYYKRQAGNGLPVFIGGKSQRGNGLGGLLSGLARMVVPVLKRGGKSILKETLRTGVGMLGDVAAGESLKSSAKKRLRQGGARLLNQASRKINAPGPSGISRRQKGIKRRRAAPSSHSKGGVKRRKVKKHQKDIFD